MTLRHSKIIFVAAMSFFCFLVAFGNVTDYMANFPAVEQVLMLQDIFPNSTIGYRAISSPTLHHIAYGIIIFCEVSTAILCMMGAFVLYGQRHASAAEFNNAKTVAIAGLTLGFFIWQVLFMSIGGEWFGLWMSRHLSGVLATAFRIHITFLVGLVFIGLKDE